MYYTLRSFVGVGVKLFKEFHFSIVKKSQQKKYYENENGKVLCGLVGNQESRANVLA